MAQDTKSIAGSARILKNSVAMFAASLLAKGGGFIVTILVARYLGPSSLGVYAVVLAVALLLQIMSPLGQQEVIVRAIARDRSQMLVHWVNASASTLLISLLFAAGIVLYLQATTSRADAELALYIVAASLPFAGLNFIAQAALQGMERMQYQTMATLLSRIAGLVLLWILLHLGAGVWTAFLAHAVFHIVSLLVLGWHVLQCAGENRGERIPRPDFARCRSMFFEAAPFALQRFLTEGQQRLSIMILPLLITMEAVGQFNVASQITMTTSTIIPIMMLTLLPVFARSYSKDPKKSAVMAHKVLKLLLVLIFPLAFIITVAADKIILLLFGPGYEASVPALQIVIWSQVFFAADSVMKQKMIASDNERAMVRYSTLGLLANIALTIALGKVWGLLGVAVAAVSASAFLLTLNARFVERHIATIHLFQAVGKPFVGALLAGAVALALVDQGLMIMLPVTACSYVILLLLIRTFSGEELLLFKQLFQRLRP